MSVQVLGDAEAVAVRPERAPQSAPDTINPLEPAAGLDGSRFPLQSHASMVRALFLAVFDERAPFPQVLSAGILRSYQRAGWDLITGEPAEPGQRPAYPTLEDLEAAALSVIDDAGYGREDGDVRALISDRIRAVSPGSGDDREGVFYAGSLLIQVIELLRLRKIPSATGPASIRPTTEMFAKLLVEIRGSGEEPQSAA